jgi:hypothetical protein
LPSEGEKERVENNREIRKKLKSYQIPKRNWGKQWNDEQLENLRKNWLHLNNFSDSVLKLLLWLS